MTCIKLDTACLLSLRTECWNHTEFLFVLLFLLKEEHGFRILWDARFSRRYQDYGILVKDAVYVDRYLSPRSLPHQPALKMEATRSYEISASIYQTERRRIAECRNLGFIYWGCLVRVSWEDLNLNGRKEQDAGQKLEDTFKNSVP